MGIDSWLRLPEATQRRNRATGIRIDMIPIVDDEDLRSSCNVRSSKYATKMTVGENPSRLFQEDRKNEG